MSSKKTLEARKRLLRVRELMLQESDADHGITVNRLRELLSEDGIRASYNAVSDDIRALREFGMDITTKRGDRRGSRVTSREFTDAEVRLVANAIQGCKFLSDAQSRELVGKLAELASANVQDTLVSEVCVDVRMRMGSIDAYDNADAISFAIHRGRKISFRYYSYGFDLQKHARHDGKRYLQTPVSLVYSNDSYYVRTWDAGNAATHGGNDFLTFRVDRMGDVAVTAEPADSNRAIDAERANIGEFVANALDMYSSKPVKLILDAEERGMDMIIDRFGIDSVKVRRLQGRNEVRRVHVRTTDGPVLDGWLVTARSSGITLVEKRYAD